MANSDLRSVRIEVGTVSESVTGAPEPFDNPSFSRWPLVVGLVAVAVLALAVVFARPEGDQAADGTERLAPTTTIPELSEPGVEDGATTTSEPEEGLIEPATILVDDPVASVRVESPRRIDQIVSINDGFLALPDVQSSEVPQVLGSIDGLDWVEVETSRIDETPESGTPFDWFSLLAGEGGLTMLGSPDPGAGQLEVFTSQDGVLWQPLEGLGPVTDIDRRVVPVVVGPDSIVGLELFDSLELGPLSSQLIEPREPGVCSAYQAGAVEFTLSECADFSVSRNRGSFEAPNATAVECAAVKADGGTPGFGLIDIDLSTSASGQDPIEGPTVFFAAGDFFPRSTDLGGGRIGVLDVGNDDVVLCDGPATLRSRGAGVVVVDAEADRTFGYPAPDALVSDVENRFDNQVLGEVHLTNDRSHLVVAIGGAMWAIDTLSGEWTVLTERLDDLGFQAPFNPKFAASSSGDRFYRVANNSVAVFELSIDEDGVPRATTTIAPLATDSAEAVISGFGSIMHATDEVMFYTDGITVWHLELPEAVRG